MATRLRLLPRARTSSSRRKWSSASICTGARMMTSVQRRRGLDGCACYRDSPDPPRPRTQAARHGSLRTAKNRAIGAGHDAYAVSCLAAVFVFCNFFGSRMPCQGWGPWLYHHNLCPSQSPPGGVAPPQPVCPNFLAKRPEPLRDVLSEFLVAQSLMDDVGLLHVLRRRR